MRTCWSSNSDIVKFVICIRLTEQETLTFRPFEIAMDRRAENLFQRAKTCVIVWKNGYRNSAPGNPSRDT